MFVASHRPTLSYQRLKVEQPLSDEELHDKMRRTISNKHELQVLEAFLIFNRFVFDQFWEDDASMLKMFSK